MATLTFNAYIVTESESSFGVLETARASEADGCKLLFVPKSKLVNAPIELDSRDIDVCVIFKGKPSIPYRGCIPNRFTVLQSWVETMQARGGSIAV